MNRKSNAIVHFIIQELYSFMFLLWMGISALIGGALIAAIPIIPILVGFYNL